MSLAGPLIVVSLIGFWAFGLTLGAALVIQPELGTAIRLSSGDAPRDFVTALVVAGNSLSIVGGGDYLDPPLRHAAAQDAGCQLPDDPRQHQ